MKKIFLALAVLMFFSIYQVQAASTSWNLSNSGGGLAVKADCSATIARGTSCIQSSGTPTPCYGNDTTCVPFGVGSQGPKGDTGATGATGPQGPAGATDTLISTGGTGTVTFDITSILQGGRLVSNTSGSVTAEIATEAMSFATPTTAGQSAYFRKTRAMTVSALSGICSLTTGTITVTLSNCGLTSLATCTSILSSNLTVTGLNSNATISTPSVAAYSYLKTSVTKTGAGANGTCSVNMDFR